MANAKLVLSPVLNFAIRAKKAGNANVDIVKTGCGFFCEEAISEAKKVIWSAGSFPTRPTERLKVTDTFQDILKVLEHCDKNSIALPKFVIFEPDDVPLVPGEVSATLARKVNELCSEFRNFVSSNSHSDKSPRMSDAAATSSHVNAESKPSYAVVLKNLPKSLDSPNARKDFLDSICPVSEDISELRKSKQDWKLFVKSKSSAAAIVEKMKTTTPGVSATMKERLFIGVLKRVPPGMSHEEVVSLVPTATRAVEIGNYEHAKVFKVYFENRKDLDQFLSCSVRVGYEKLPVDEFKFLPKRCYSCHGHGHIAADCSQTPLCGHCGSSDHVSSKDLKCTKDMFCVSCKKNGHTCYSIRCPSNAAISSNK